MKVDMPDRSYSGIVKRIIKEAAVEIGFKKSGLGEVELIISELVSNANKYANEKCYFLYKTIVEDDIAGIEIIYNDYGPGMEDPAKMLEDGVTSSSESRGEGLGAVFRLSDFFDIHSQLNTGTVILIRKFLKSKVKQEILPEITIGAVGVATPGEINCGDSWHCIQENNTYHTLVTDGLGHGKMAWEASVEAIETFKNNFTLSAPEHIVQMHEDLKKTRGVVGFICTADYDNNEIRSCGIGNIAAKVVYQDNISNCISFNGIVGYTLPARIHENITPWHDRSLFIAHSDGILTKWNLNDYPDIEKHDPSLIAAVIYKNHYRSHDDALVLVLKRYKNQSHPFSFMFSYE